MSISDASGRVIADATASVAQSVDAFSASAVAAGMRDTDVACRVAMMLMAAQYDDLSDDGYVAARDKVISILQVPVCPCLLSRTPPDPGP